MINNNEYMLLSLLWQSEQASGYQLNKIIDSRGYRAWADIGMTSIYATLKKLDKKGLIVSHLITDKTTTGPAAKVYALTDDGLHTLREATCTGLSQTRERDRRFDLALSTTDLLPHDQVLDLIDQRKSFLQKEHARLSAVYASQQPHIALTGSLLFQHTLRFIDSELTFLDDFIDQWKDTAHDH